MEYLCFELFELSGTAAKDHWSITARHIMLAITGDEELNKLFSKFEIADGGAVTRVSEGGGMIAADFPCITSQAKVY